MHLAQQGHVGDPRCRSMSRGPWPSNERTWRTEADRGPWRPPRRQGHGVGRPHPGPRPTSTRVDSAWVTQTADRVVAVVEQSRPTWQTWHVRAEAQRQVRATDARTHSADALVDLLVEEVLISRSVPLRSPHDGVEEPEVLRRVRRLVRVYRCWRHSLHLATHPQAEQRLIATAGRHDGVGCRPVGSGLALLEMAANGTSARRRSSPPLVRVMCTSGACLQLAIAPAGAGKTTAHACARGRVDPGRRPGHRPRAVRRRGRGAR